VTVSTVAGDKEMLYTQAVSRRLLPISISLKNNLHQSASTRYNWYLSSSIFASTFRNAIQHWQKND